MSMAPVCRTHNVLMHPLIVSKSTDKFTDYDDIPGGMIIYNHWICDECEKDIKSQLELHQPGRIQ